MHFTHLCLQWAGFLLRLVTNVFAAVWNNRTEVAGKRACEYKGTALSALMCTGCCDQSLGCQVGMMLLASKVHSNTRHLVGPLQVLSSGLCLTDQHHWLGRPGTGIRMAPISAARNSTRACMRHACKCNIGLGKVMQVCSAGTMWLERKLTLLCFLAIAGSA